MVTTATTDRPRSRPATDPADLSLAEGVCLTLITQRLSHGWAIGTALAPGGDIGRVWSHSRPLTYRTLDALAEKGLITRRERAGTSGRERTLLSATAAGRRRSARWLDEPVRHLRDVRTELLVKLALRTRAGIDNAPLLEAQQAVFAPTIDKLIAGSDSDLVAVWRREHARAVRRFLSEARDPDESASGVRPEMRLSARNQLKARVTSVQRGELMASVKAVLGDGQPLTAAITQEASDDLDLAAGDSIVLIVKATEVMVAKAPA